MDGIFHHLAPEVFVLYHPAYRAMLLVFKTIKIRQQLCFNDFWGVSKCLNIGSISQVLIILQNKFSLACRWINCYCSCCTSIMVNNQLYFLSLCDIHHKDFTNSSFCPIKLVIYPVYCQAICESVCSARTK